MRRFWNSDLLVSWGVFAVRFASTLVVVPAVLVALPPADVALWLLLTLILGLAGVVSFGLQATFTRLFSYAMGGAPVSRFPEATSLAQRREAMPCEPAAATPDTEALARVATTLYGMGAALTMVAALLFGVGGTVASARLVDALERPETGWAVVAITVVGAVALVWGQVYVAFLMGVNRVLTLRRWEFVTDLGQAASLIATILLDGGLLALICIANGWAIFGIARNGYLSRRYDVDGAFSRATPALDQEVVRKSWPAQWRLGLGVLFSLGVVQLSGVAAAQVGSPGQVASYLFHLRLITLVNNFSLPPLYNRVPQLAQHMAAGRLDLLRDLARRRMAIAYWTFAGAFFAIGISGQWFIDTFATADYVFSPLLWGAFGLALFAERVCGMHMQLYMLTNRVLYLLNVASGALYLLLAVILNPVLGMVAFPLAYLAGLVLAFGPFIVPRVHRAFDLPFPEFQLRTSVPALLAMLAFILSTVLI